jgi:hypothetical protein
MVRKPKPKTKTIPKKTTTKAKVAQKPPRSKDFTIRSLLVVLAESLAKNTNLSDFGWHEAYENGKKDGFQEGVDSAGRGTAYTNGLNAGFTMAVQRQKEELREEYRKGFKDGVMGRKSLIKEPEAENG